METMNGRLDRRAFLRGGAAMAAAMTGATFVESAAAEPLADDPWSLVPGTTVPAYGVPSRFEKNVARTLSNPNGEPRTSHARTPHHLLHGTTTPNPLHFVISHAGDAQIDPDKHRLVIHGLVKRPLLFTLEALARYPMVSRTTFVECAGSSAPLSKGLDDAIVALYQNGERLMPGNGYPMRLLLPGYEGNMNVKWLRRIQLTEAPAMSYYEARTYAPILPNGKAYQFFFLQEVKSFITHPSPGLMLKAPGFYEISGIAYSGNGRISKVMVSADGGQSWAQAALHEPVLSKAFTRFRVPWNWNGGPAVLQSRAWDEAGNVQPTRAQIIAVRGQSAKVPPVTAFPSQHYNGVTSWAVSSAGAVSHVYA